MPRRISGCNTQEVTGGWRKIHNEKLHNFYSSTNIMRMTKSGRMRCVGNVGEHIKFWSESLKTGDGKVGGGICRNGTSDVD
jgi:hypothetical protein